MLGLPGFPNLRSFAKRREHSSAGFLGIGAAGVGIHRGACRRELERGRDTTMMLVGGTGRLRRTGQCNGREGSLG